MSERRDHTVGFESCEQYVVHEEWTHPQGITVRRRFGVYARNATQAEVTSRVCFIWILRQLGFKV